MTSWKGMYDRPEMVHLCCENKIKTLDIAGDQLE